VMATARKPLLLIVLTPFLSLSPGVTAAAAIEACSAADREALLVGALDVEVRDSLAERIRGQKTECVVVAVGEGERAVDPPDRVMIRLKRIVRTRVVARSRAAGCASNVETWVGEPLCVGVTRQESAPSTTITVDWALHACVVNGIPSWRMCANRAAAQR
jgi:hypothetical protein